jgi:hypothetical protein
MGAHSFRCFKCKVMVDPDERGACPQCGTSPPSLLMASPAGPEGAAPGPTPASPFVPPIAHVGSTFADRVKERLSTRPWLAYAAVALVLALVVGGVAVRRAFATRATAAGTPAGSTLVTEMADPSLADDFRPMVGDRAGVSVRLPPDFEPTPQHDSTHRSPAGDSIYFSLFFPKDEREAAFFLAAIEPAADLSAYGSDPKIVELTRTITRAFAEGMARNWKVEDASVSRCGLVTSGSRRLGACRGEYVTDDGNGPVGAYCELDAGEVFCFGYIGHTGLDERQLNAVAVTTEVL